MAEPKIIQFPIGDVHHLQWRYKKVEVSSAEILTLNSVPKELVPAPGVGKALLFSIGALFYDYGTIAYATNTDISIRYDGSANNLIGLAGIINQVADVRKNMIISSGTLWEENKALELIEATGDPTAGDGTLTIYLWYINVEL